MTKCQAGTIRTSHVMGCQVHTIGKTIRPLFEDPITNTVLCNMCTHISSMQYMNKPIICWKMAPVGCSQTPMWLCNLNTHTCYAVVGTP